MKNILSAVVLAVVFTMLATAQDVRKPTMTMSRSGDASFHGSPGWGNPPANAADLIFYGGDVNASDPHVNAYPNGNTLLVPNTTTYGAVTVPANSKVVASGVLFNQIAILQGDIFDPATATYDVRIGVSEGNGGTSVLSGSNHQYSQTTGRMPFSYVEYATSVAFTQRFTPTPGTTYWVNLSSQCTDSSNSLCTGLQFFEDNTTQKTNGINANVQPAYQAFFNSAFFGYNWPNVCDLVGGESPLCEYLSFGIYGR